MEEDEEEEQQRQQMMEIQIQQMQQQFSEQLQRLEENHQSEILNSNKQFDSTVQHWQKEVHDRESLITTQSKQSDQQYIKLKEQFDGIQKQLKTKVELLIDKEKEDRRIQELHLKQLRDMEKQVNRREDTSNNLGQTVQNLEVSFVF
jgi:hypothetical protein